MTFDLYLWFSTLFTCEGSWIISIYQVWFQSDFSFSNEETWALLTTSPLMIIIFDPMNIQRVPYCINNQVWFQSDFNFSNEVTFTFSANHTAWRWCVTFDIFNKWGSQFASMTQALVEIHRSMRKFKPNVYLFSQQTTTTGEKVTPVFSFSSKAGDTHKKMYFSQVWHVHSKQCTSLKNIIYRTYGKLFSQKSRHQFRLFSQRTYHEFVNACNEVSFNICFYPFHLQISVLMGFTWIFGYIASFTGNDGLWYLFIICNSSQGFLVFLTNTCNKRVYQCYKKKFFGRENRVEPLREEHQPVVQHPQHREPPIENDNKSFVDEAKVEVHERREPDKSRNKIHRAQPQGLDIDHPHSVHKTHLPSVSGEHKEELGQEFGLRPLPIGSSPGAPSLLDDDDNNEKVFFTIPKDFSNTSKDLGYNSKHTVTTVSQNCASESIY